MHSFVQVLHFPFEKCYRVHTGNHRDFGCLVFVPYAGCAYATNSVGRDLDIFAIGAISLNYIYNPLLKIVNIFCVT
jgi:hypothetical protein